MPILEKKNLSVIRKKGDLPKVNYSLIKKSILGDDYNLSIIFCTPNESKIRNKTYRDKDYPTNILSFPLSKSEGEIYISLKKTRSDAKNFDMSYIKFLHLLLIHGMLHLKGHEHSSKMEEQEDKYLKKFFRGS